MLPDENFGDNNGSDSFGENRREIVEEEADDVQHDSNNKANNASMNQLAQRMFFAKQVAYVYDLFTYNTMKVNTRWFLDVAACHVTITFEDITLLMTCFVLFADDIKLMTTSRDVDPGFSTAYAICLFVFIAELLATTWSKTEFTSCWPLKWTGYFMSFFWFLDLVAILSLFPDVTIIAGPLGIGGISNSVDGGNYTQAGRVVRLVRLVRLVRVYKIASERRKRKQQEEELMELVRVGAISFEDIERQQALYSNRQSRLGDQLSESTTRRVIIMILILLIIIPLLLIQEVNDGMDFGFDMLHKFNYVQNVTNAAKQTVLDSFIDGFEGAYHNRFIEYLVVEPTFGSAPIVSFPAHLASLRDAATIDEDKSTMVGSIVYTTKCIFNLNVLIRDQALNSILLTICVAIILVSAAVIFTNDAERLVITPIERMMNMVEAVAANPLAPLYFENDDDNSAGQYETKLLEKTVEKITGLLRVGFGEAGAGIISANLQATDSSAAINPLLPGVRIYAVFGFCDIHHFEDINQKLSNDVLTFVNTIAEIVHNSVHTWSGQCNKNLGNAFVIVWRIGDEHTLQSAFSGGGRMRSVSQESMNVGSSVKASSVKMPAKQNSMESMSSLMGSDEPEGKKKNTLVDLRRVSGVDILADQALIGYCKIITEINRNKGVLKYRQEPRLTEQGKVDFKVTMGFGLHAGWAIEGAVGSVYKVDATYLSPHVNMAARLETSSKQYGVPLLASQDFFDLMSNTGQSVMRRLDVVTVKGSEVPIGIYTYDCVQDQEFKEDRIRRRPSLTTLTAGIAGGPSTKSAPSTTLDSLSTHGLGGKRPSVSMIPGESKGPMWLNPDDPTDDVFENDYDMLTLRKHITPEFLDAFKEGIQLYLSGDWTAARTLLEKSNTMMKEMAPVLGGDGPSKTLLNYMSNHNYEAPKSWKGFRPLTAK